MVAEPLLSPKQGIALMVVIFLSLAALLVASIYAYNAQAAKCELARARCIPQCEVVGVNPGELWVSEDALVKEVSIEREQVLGAPYGEYNYSRVEP